MAAAGGELRIGIRVTPGARRAHVGGDHDGDLVVRVTARAVDGRATEAALDAVADALGVRRRRVRLVRGATSRRKLVAVAADGDGTAPSRDLAEVAARAEALRAET